MSGETIRTSEPVDMLSPSAVTEADRQQEAETLLDSQVLDAKISATIRRYGQQIESGYFLTPEVEVAVGDERRTVFAGHANDDYYRKTLFTKDTDTDEVMEWVAIDSFQIGIYDGSGRRIDSTEERQFVRDVLEAMDQRYEQDVVELADTFDIKGHLTSRIEHDIEIKKAELDSLLLQRASLAQKEGFTNYRVTIRSGWEDNGELPLELDVHTPTISDALRQAADRFKHINGRSDIQASSYSVQVVVGGKMHALPYEVTDPLFRALSVWDKETWAKQQVEERRAQG